MADVDSNLPHLWVRGRAEDREFRRRGGGDPKIRDVESRSHGIAIGQQLGTALSEADQARETESLEELEALGSIIVLEAADNAFPLKLESLESYSNHRNEPKRPRWLLLSVMAESEDQPERATVWVSDEYREAFLRLFEAYREQTSQAGQPRNRALVANIGRIRAVVLRDLWQSQGDPPDGSRWWELWLRPTDDGVELLKRFAAAMELPVANRVMRLNDRTIAWVEARWPDLSGLPFSAVPVAEIRNPEFVDTVEDFDRDDQDELAGDLLERVSVANGESPAVCHLDSGVRRSHVLLTGSLSEADTHSIVPGTLADLRNHGTMMAGLALFGPLDDLLLGNSPVLLRHRLESVKMLPDAGHAPHDPSAYGLTTAEAVSIPEATTARKRTFCMPVTATSERPGEPTLWSASVDALAAGVDISTSEDGIDLLGAPDPAASRLFIVSAGNVGGSFRANYLNACDLAAIEDPAHAWNALTVGAHTELTEIPNDPSFDGWEPLAEAGDLSPHSRTSLLFDKKHWPLKPDICMEGGNVLSDGGVGFHDSHPLLTLRTTDARDDLALGSANATSAATAQAARLGALVQASYPEYWPETVRALLVHSADWTGAMRQTIDDSPTKSARVSMLRRYGWGVPSEAAVLSSSPNAVTIVVQDQFVPFDGPEFASRRFRLHQLPWPSDALRELDAADVSLRVTLSYFIEPTASRRGWRKRYAYPSHSLRFELKDPAESVDAFVRRVNRDAIDEEAGETRSSGPNSNWLIGPNQRNHGSIHQDIWEGSGAELADTGSIAVHPVGGWWKNNKRADRIEMQVRYSLIVSLRTPENEIDLYTPIATELQVPINVEIPAT